MRWLFVLVGKHRVAAEHTRIRPCCKVTVNGCLSCSNSCRAVSGDKEYHSLAHAVAALLAVPECQPQYQVRQDLHLVQDQRQ